jgi:DNA-binding transcriptional ArsR family regulator
MIIVSFFIGEISACSPIGVRAICRDLSMAPDKRVPIPVLKLIASKLKLLAQENRLRILNELRGGEKSVTELIVATGGTQANISKHLGVMRGKGIVTCRRNGLNVFYSISDRSVFKLCDLMCNEFRREMEKAVATVKVNAFSNNEVKRGKSARAGL